MNESDLIYRIKEIIFYMPGEMYKFSPPENCSDDEWQNAPMEEKAFLLIEELLLNFNREEKMKKKKQEHHENTIEIKLPFGPRFYTQADESMFFSALESVLSFIEVKGSGRGLFLYFKSPISEYEKDFLIGLFRRYQVPISTSIKKFLKQ
ncbi:MAG: hypothetical protein ABF633_00710 [Clostridium sp.]|uniref:hypothetical protein n=1 Tax=Clostridium sp. TaxID=1506 RepID=UPI0039EC0051